MLRGKTAVVTGSTSGIGLGIARALAGSGANIVLNGFGAPEAIDEIKSEIDAVSLKRVNDYLKEHPPKDFKFVAIGPRELSFRVKE